jgi:hypothetical protein
LAQDEALIMSRRRVRPGDPPTPAPEELEIMGQDEVGRRFIERRISPDRLRAPRFSRHGSRRCLLKGAERTPPRMRPTASLKHELVRSERPGEVYARGSPDAWDPALKLRFAGAPFLSPMGLMRGSAHWPLAPGTKARAARL